MKSEPLRMITIELPGANIKRVDSKAIVENIKNIGANTAVIFANSYVDGRVYYSSAVAEKHPDLEKNRDLFKELVTEARKQGLNVFAYLNAKFSGKYVLKRYPDSEMIGPGKNFFGIGDQIMTCPNTSFMKFFKKQVYEVCANYDIDGIFIDELSFQGWCTCKSCRKDFKKKHNQDLPMEVKDQNWGSQQWKNFLSWRYECVGKFAKEIYEEVKEINNDIKCFFQGAFPLSAREFRPEMSWRSSKECSGWYTPLFYAQGLDIYRLEDILQYENYGTGRGMPIWWIGASLKLGRSIAPDKPRTVLLEYPYLPWITSSLPKDELELKAFEVVANQGSPWFPMYAPGLADERGWKSVEKVLNFMKENPEICQMQSLASIALIFSRETADFYGNSAAKQNYLNEIYGFYRMLLEEQVQFDILTTQTLKERHLEQYKTLILPNLACLNEPELANIRQFVENGGNLLMTYETGFYDKFGNRKKNFGFKDLIGGDVRGDKLELGYGYLRVKEEHPITKGFKKNSLIQVAGDLPEIELKSDSTKNLAAIVKGPENFFALIGEDIALPSLICGRYGAGKFVYIPLSLGKIYHMAEIADLKRLTKNILSWFDSESVKVEIKEARAIEVLAYFNSSKDRFIICLLNHVTTNVRRMTSITPLKDLTLKISNLGIVVHQVRSLLSSEKLKFMLNEDTVEIKIKQLKVFEAIEVI